MHTFLHKIFINLNKYTLINMVWIVKLQNGILKSAIQ